MRENYDFSNAKHVHEVPALAKLQAEHHKAETAKGKTRVTIYLDSDVVDVFRERSVATGKGYQTLINDTLRASLSADAPLTAELLRQILHDELQAS